MVKRKKLQKDRETRRANRKVIIYKCILFDLNQFRRANAGPFEKKVTLKRVSKRNEVVKYGRKMDSELGGTLRESGEMGWISMLPINNYV